MPDDGNRLAADGVEYVERVAHVGVPGVEGGMLGIAVAALIPRDDAEAAGGEQWREDVVGAREIEAAVREQQRRCLLVAPLVDRDAEAARIHETQSNRRLGARIRDDFGMRCDGRLAHRARILGFPPRCVRRARVAAAGSRSGCLPRSPGEC